MSSDPVFPPLPRPAKQTSNAKTVLHGILGLAVVLGCCLIWGFVYKATLAPQGSSFASSSVRGIGVSRTEVANNFRKLGFVFQGLEEMRGFPFQQGLQEDQIVDIHLVGPPDKLVYARAQINMEALSENDPQYGNKMAMMAVFLAQTVPELQGGDKAVTWFGNAMAELASRKGQKQFELDSKQAKVSLSVQQRPHVITITVESKDW